MNKDLPHGWLQPAWPAPPNVRAMTTTRMGGVSEGRYASLNLGTHVGDQADDVFENRRRLRQGGGLPAEPVWLNQVHGCAVARLSADSLPGSHADASVTSDTNVVCAVLTADCLPLLICDRQGTYVAAVHAGWRGLANGVIEATLDAMESEPDDLMVWLGPAIGPSVFEVGKDVREAFLDINPGDEKAFKNSRAGHWLADLYMLACSRLEKRDVRHVYGGGLCTYSQNELFFSYRRYNATGRMATLIWKEGADVD